MMRSVLVHRLRLLGLALVSLAGNDAYALDMGVGFSSVEEGDDRPRPAVNLDVKFKDTYRARLYVYGRDFGPVKERVYLLSGTHKVVAFKSTFLHTSVGVAILSQQTAVAYQSDINSAENVSENNFNLGGAFNIGARYPTGRMYFSADWDSHVFPAGIGGILLSSGRKQTLSLTMGVSLR